jgi:hypothetical protein
MGDGVPTCICVVIVIVEEGIVFGGGWLFDEGFIFDFF